MFAGVEGGGGGGGVVGDEGGGGGVEGGGGGVERSEAFCALKNARDGFGPGGGVIFFITLFAGALAALFISY